MNNGWVKNHRKILEWEWYKTPNMYHVFSTLVLLANHEEKKWQGQIIKRGQLVTGRKSLSQITGISEQQIRTCIKRLKSTNHLTIKSTNQFSIITLKNYDKYQTTNQQPNQQLTNNQPTTNHKQEDKEIKNNLESDQNLFREEVESFTDKYDLKMLTAFWAYWSEPNKTKTRMRKDLEKTWDTERRLLTWNNRQKK
jgi:hypothetical protein